MKRIKIPLSYWYVAAILLCIPAFLINLDLMTLNEDESIRALVALEMKLSGDFFTPTLNNTLYYSKPPLYNWILNLSFLIFGTTSEWALRIPTIIFLGCFAISIFLFSRKYYDREFAFVNAMIFITCGRVLFWDSMLGYIDICYSWITFMQIMLIYFCYQQKKYRKLFLLSYFLAAIGFMLKGFPTIMFQGLSLLAFLWYKRDLKRLFSLNHFLGLGVFILIVGSYYLYYFSVNPENNALTGLLDQSVRRTVVHEKNSLWEFVKHIFLYPFQNTYDFLPWSIMIIYIFRRDLFKIILSNGFLKFCATVWGINIIVYWTSVEVYPRYILMLVPILFTIFLYFHKIHYEEESLLYKIFVYFSLFVIAVGTILNIGYAFAPQVNDVNYSLLKSSLIAIPLIFIGFYFYHHKSQRLLCLICALLLARIGFNFFILPDRHEHDLATRYKAEAIAIGEKYQNEDLRLFENSKVDFTSSFYITSTRNQITKRDFEHSNSEAYYIIDTTRHEIPLEFDTIETFQNREANKRLTIIKLKE